MQCDSCGRDLPEGELQEFKLFGQRSYICRECKKTQVRHDE
jgi:hypothetical protein